MHCMGKGVGKSVSRVDSQHDRFLLNFRILFNEINNILLNNDGKRLTSPVISILGYNWRKHEKYCCL